MSRRGNKGGRNVGGRFGNRGRGGRFGSRGRGDSAQGRDILVPRDALDVVEICMFHKTSEGNVAIMDIIGGGDNIPRNIPQQGAPIYLKNKTHIGCVDDIMGRINEPRFTVKMNEGIAAKSFSVGEKFFINPARIQPMSSFFPEVKKKPVENKFELISTIKYKEPVYCRDGITTYIAHSDQPVYLIELKNSRKGNEKVNFERLSKLHSMSNILGTFESETSSRFVMQYGLPLGLFFEGDYIDEKTCQGVVQEMVEAVDSVIAAGFSVSDFAETDFYVLDSDLESTERRWKIKYASFQKCEKIVAQKGDALRNARERTKTLTALSKLIARVCKNVVFSPENEILLTRFITDLLAKSKPESLTKIVLKNHPFFWSFYKRLDWYVEFSQWLKRGFRCLFDRHKERGGLYEQMGGKPFDAGEGWQMGMAENLRDFIEQGLIEKDTEQAEPTTGQQAKPSTGRQAKPTTTKKGFKMKSVKVGLKARTFNDLSKKSSYLVQAYRNLIIHGWDRQSGITTLFNDPEDLFKYFSREFPALLDFCYRFARYHCKDTYLRNKFDLHF